MQIHLVISCNQISFTSAMTPRVLSIKFSTRPRCVWRTRAGALSALACSVFAHDDLAAAHLESLLECMFATIPIKQSVVKIKHKLTLFS